MKKTIALLACLTMAAGLFACKNKTKPAGKTDARTPAARTGAATSRKAPEARRDAAPAARRDAAPAARDAKKAAKAPATR